MNLEMLGMFLRKLLPTTLDKLWAFLKYLTIFAFVFALIVGILVAIGYADGSQFMWDQP